MAIRNSAIRELFHYFPAAEMGWDDHEEDGGNNGNGVRKRKNGLIDDD